MKKVARYLVARVRVVWEYKWQDGGVGWSVRTDSDWGGDKKTRKSTSGGAVLYGTHLLKTWAKTQAVIAKSSAESEIYALVRASCEALGFCMLLSELGKEVKSKSTCRCIRSQKHR